MNYIGLCGCYIIPQLTHIGYILFLRHKTEKAEMEEFMPQGAHNSSAVGKSITEQVDTPTVHSTGSYPAIGLFNARLQRRVADQDRYFRGKWFEKIACYLFKLAD